MKTENKFNMPDYYCKLVKRNIRRVKEANNWTIPVMSQMVHISEGYLGSILSMKSDKTPSIYLLAQISEKTDTNITFFFQEHEQDD